MTYAEVLEISVKNEGTPTSFQNIEDEQIYQQRVENLRFKGISAVIVFVQNVTNIQKLQQLEA